MIRQGLGLALERGAWSYFVVWVFLSFPFDFQLLLGAEVFTPLLRTELCPFRSYPNPQFIC